MMSNYPLNTQVPTLQPRANDLLNMFTPCKKHFILGLCLRLNTTSNPYKSMIIMAKKDVKTEATEVVEVVETEVVETEVVDTPVIKDIIQQVAEKAATAEAARLAAVEAKEAAKKAKEEEKAAKKAAKEAGVKIKAEKALAIIQNGVARPRANSACGKIWAYCDAISKEMKQPAPIAAVLEVSKVHTENGVVSPFHPTTVRCQFAKWRKFNGVVAVKAEKAIASVEAVSEPVVIDEDTIVEDTFGVEDVVV